MRGIIIAFFVILMTPVAVQAKWMEASSQHFLIYADETQASLQEFADQLERFHQALALAVALKSETPSPSNRVTIYVVRSPRAVQHLASAPGSRVYAYYSARAGGSFAIVPRLSIGRGELDMPMVALLHEYVHHFMLANSAHSWPQWFAEGSAEFYASARFPKDGSVILGLPAQHRAAELYFAPAVSAKALLDPERYPQNVSKIDSEFYGKSWLLYHYLSLTPARKGQFYAYIRLLLEGKSSIGAAETAFGDLDVLERDLRNYLGKKMAALNIDPQGLKPGAVTIRDLSAGETAMMPLRVRLKNRHTTEAVTALLPDMQTVAARFPTEATVLGTLSEAEFRADNYDAAIRAADAALAIDPRLVDALLHKGLSLFHKAPDAEDPKAAYTEARKAFVALNTLENNHPLPLFYYYRTYADQGIAPPKAAVDALERAAELARFDTSIRMTLVSRLIRDKRYDDAIAQLAPIAFTSHGGSDSDAAQHLMKRLKARAPLEDLSTTDLMADYTANPAEGAEGND